MTNATVARVAPVTNGRTMTLHYKDGEQTIVVPDGVPVITLQPGDPLAPGAGREGHRHRQLRGGPPAALRAAAGSDGFAPPM